jgi:GLPGLI family protein
MKILSLLSLYSIVNLGFVVNNKTFLTPSNSKANLLAKYSLVYKPDSNSQEKKTEYVNLTINGNYSKFETVGNFLRDSLSKAAQPTGSDIQAYVDKVAALPRTNFKFFIIKDYQRKSTALYQRVGSTLYVVKQPLESFKWEIKPETTTLYGYACQRAITRFGGREYAAWFTREVPVSDGPYKFCGLPGLILEVKDEKENYAFKIVSLKKPGAPLVTEAPAPAASPTTMALLRKGQLNFDLSMPQKMAGMGNSTDAEKVRLYKERLLKFNNHLEK